MTDLSPRESGINVREALDAFELGYNGTGMRAQQQTGDFSWYHSMAGNSDVTLRACRFDAALEGEIEPDHEYIVSWFSEGRGVVDAGRRERMVAPQTPVVFPSDRGFRFAYSPFKQNLVHFDRAYLDRVAAEQTGREPAPLRFDHVRPLDPAALTLWRNTSSVVARMILTPAANPLVLAEAAREAAVVMLAVFPHEVASTPARSRLPRHASVSRAVEFIHQFAHLPIGPSEIAEAAGTGTRALQLGFHRHFACTPSHYLRMVRLDRVRVDLLAARSDPDATVSRIASGWGFAHPGRFSAQYWRAFGEYPSQTIATD